MAVPRYCLIAPCRDEARFLERTVASIASQTILPSLLVLVDDGSTDATPEIADRLARTHAWIRVVHRQDRGRRSVGPGVIDAFYAGRRLCREVNSAADKHEDRQNVPRLARDLFFLRFTSL